MDAAVSVSVQPPAKSVALLGARYHCLGRRAAVSTGRNADIGLLMRAVCLGVGSSSGTTNGGGGSAQAQRERKAHGRKWCGHNMAKHIAGKALGLVLLPVAFEVSLFVLYNHPPTPAWCSFSSARPLTHGSLSWVLPPVAASLAVGGCFFLKH